MDFSPIGIGGRLCRCEERGGLWLCGRLDAFRLGLVFPEQRVGNLVTFFRRRLEVRALRLPQGPLLPDLTRKIAALCIFASERFRGRKTHHFIIGQPAFEKVLHHVAAM